MALGNNWGLTVSINFKALQSFNTSSKALERGAERIAQVGVQANKAIANLGKNLSTQVKGISDAVRQLEQVVSKANTAASRFAGSGFGGGGDFVFPRTGHARRGPKAGFATDTYMRRQFGMSKGLWDEYAPETRKQVSNYSAFVGTFPRPNFRGAGANRERYYTRDQFNVTLMMGKVTAPIVKAIERLDAQMIAAINRLASGGGLARDVVTTGPSFSRPENVTAGSQAGTRQARGRSPPLAANIGSGSSGAAHDLAKHIEHIDNTLWRYMWPLFKRWAAKEGVEFNSSKGGSTGAIGKRRGFRPMATELGRSTTVHTPGGGGFDIPVEDELQTPAKFRRAMSRVLNYGSAGTIVYGAATQIRDAIKDMAEFEMEIKKVQQTMNPFTKDFFTLAKGARELGQSFGTDLSEVARTMAAFAKQGMNVNQILGETKTVLVATNTTQLDAKEATEGLIAAQKQFILSTDDSMKVLDSWVSLQNKTGVSAENFADATKKAGVAARAAGVDFETFNDIVAAMGERTRRSGDTIGTSLNEVFQKMRTLKSVESLQDVGIFSEDAQGNFRSAKDVIDELARKWPKLTDAQRNNIAVNIAGTERLNDFVSMMETWRRAMDLSSQSANNQGTALKANAVIMESLEKKVESLKASLQGLYTQAGESGLLQSFKAMVDLANQAVRLFSTINKYGGGLPAGLLGTGALIAGGAAVSRFTGHVLIPSFRAQEAGPLSGRSLEEMMGGSAMAAELGGGGGEPSSFRRYLLQRGRLRGMGLLAGSALAQYGYERAGLRAGPGEAPSIRDTLLDVTTTGTETAGLLGLFGGARNMWKSGKLGKFGVGTILAAGALNGVGQIQRYFAGQQLANAANAGPGSLAVAPQGPASHMNDAQAVAITQGRNISQLVIQYGRVIDRLISKNNDLLRNVEMINNSVAQMSFVSPESFIGSRASVANVQRTLTSLNEIEQRGVRNFAAPNYTDPRGIQNALIDLRGNINMQSKAPFGLSQTGMLNAQFMTEDMANKFVETLEEPIRRMFSDKGNMLLTNPENGTTPEEKLYYQRLKAMLSPDVVEQITSLATRAGQSVGSPGGPKDEADRAAMQAEAVRLARGDARTNLSDVAEKLRDDLRNRTQSKLDAVQQAIQTLGSTFAERMATGRVNGIGQFMQGPEATAAQKEISGLTDSVRSVVDALEKRMTQIGPGSANYNEEDYQNTAKELEVMQASLKGLSSASDNLGDRIHNVVVGFDDLETTIMRVKTSAGQGGAFGQTGLQGEKYALGYLSKELSRLGDELANTTDVQKQGNIRKEIGELRTELVSRSRNIQTTQDYRAQLGQGLFTNVLGARLQQAVGLPVQGAIEEWRTQTELSFREMLQQMAKDFGPAVQGKGGGAINGLIEQLRPVLNVVGGRIHDLRLDTDNDFRKQYLLASPSQRIMADFIRQQIRGGSTADQIFSDPYAREAAKGNPLLDKLLDQALENDESQLKALDFQADIARYNQVSATMLQKIYDVMINPARAAAGLQKAAVPTNPFVVSGERFATGSILQAGQGNIDGYGRIKSDFTPAYLDKGEIVLNSAQSTDYLRRMNRFDSGTAARLPKALREKLAGLPSVAEGMTRLYRGEYFGQRKNFPAWMHDNEELKAIQAASGRWFARTPEQAYWYVKDAGSYGAMHYLDVPHELTSKYLVNNLPEKRFSADPMNEWFLPREHADRRRMFYDASIRTSSMDMVLAAELGRSNRASRRASLTIPTDITHPPHTYDVGDPVGAMMGNSSSINSPVGRRARVAQAFAKASKMANSNYGQLSPGAIVQTKRGFAVFKGFDSAGRPRIQRAGGRNVIASEGDFVRHVPLGKNRLIGNTSISIPGVNVFRSIRGPRSPRLPFPTTDELNAAILAFRAHTYGEFTNVPVYGAYRTGAVNRAFGQGLALASASAAERGLTPELFNEIANTIHFTSSSKPTPTGSGSAFYRGPTLKDTGRSFGFTRRQSIAFHQVPVGTLSMAEAFGKLTSHETQHAIDSIVGPEFYFNAPQETQALQNKVMHKMLVHAMMDESHLGVMAKRSVFYRYGRQISQAAASHGETYGVLNWLKEVRAAKVESGGMSETDKRINAVLGNAMVRFHSAVNAGNKNAAFRAVHHGLQHVDNILSQAGVSENATFSMRKALTGNVFSDIPDDHFTIGSSAKGIAPAVAAITRRPGLLSRSVRAIAAAHGRLPTSIKLGGGLLGNILLHSSAANNFATSHGFGGVYHAGLTAVDNYNAFTGARSIAQGQGAFGFGLMGKLAARGGAFGRVGMVGQAAEKVGGRALMVMAAYDAAVKVNQVGNVAAYRLGLMNENTYRANSGSLAYLGSVLNPFSGTGNGNEALAKQGVGFLGRLTMSNDEIRQAGLDASASDAGHGMAALRNFLTRPLGGDKTNAMVAIKALRGYGVHNVDALSLLGVIRQLTNMNTDASGLDLMNALSGRQDNMASFMDLYTNKSANGVRSVDTATLSGIGRNLNIDAVRQHVAAMASQQRGVKQAAADQVAQQQFAKVKSIFGAVRDRVAGYGGFLMDNASRVGMIQSSVQAALDSVDQAVDAQAATANAATSDAYINRLRTRPKLDISRQQAFNPTTGALIPNKFQVAVRIKGEQGYHYGAAGTQAIHDFPSLMRQYSAQQAKSALSMGIMNNFTRAMNGKNPLDMGDLWQRLAGHGTNTGFVTAAQQYLHFTDALNDIGTPGDSNQALMAAKLRQQRDQLIMESGYSPNAFDKVLQIRQSIRDQELRDANNPNDAADRQARLNSVDTTPVYRGKLHSGGQAMSSNEYILKNTEGLVLTGSRMEQVVKQLSQIAENSGGDLMQNLAGQFLGRTPGDTKFFHEHTGQVGVHLQGHQDFFEQIADAVAQRINGNANVPMKGERIRKRFEA